MPTVTLYPSIAQIERRLFAVPDDLLIRLAENDPGIPSEIRDAALADQSLHAHIENLRESLAEDASPTDEAIGTSEPPAFIKMMIRQKVAAGQADFGGFPSSGQMLQISRLPTPSGAPADLLIASPLMVLLNVQDKDTKIWHGWMMASEVQYAGFWDLLLEPEDEPFDPLCGMVQIWNPVQLYFPADYKANVVGRLNPARLSAVRALAYEFLQGDPFMPRSRPGYIAMRATENDYSIVTGSPLGGNDDPRHRYQQCYHHVAELLNAPALAWRHEAATAGIMEALLDVVAAAWRELTGIMPQPVPPVAHAMHGAVNVTQIGLALQDDLFLFLSESAAGIDLSLTYRGAEPISATVIDDGEIARSVLLDQNSTILEYSGLSIDADNRLQLDLPGNRHVELPLRVMENDAW
jgi:hypothetical protein